LMTIKTAYLQGPGCSLTDGDIDGGLENKDVVVVK